MAPDPTLAELTARLVAIDSINPDLIPGAAGEGAVAEFVAGWMRDAGLEVDLHEAAPGRPNAVGIARGSGGGRSLILNAHMDTVGVAGMERPFEAVERDGRLHGRGTGDMKGSLAAIMLVGAASAREGFRGDVIVTAVADEEVGSVGTEEIVRRYTADAAIVSEPTEEVVAVAHKGFVAFEVETEGYAAHGSRPDLGVDAIAAMGPVLTGLAELDTRLRSGAGHALLGTGSIHASLIEGGQEYSSYPAGCLLQGERRTVPGESVDDVLAELEALATPAGARARTTFHRLPFESDPGSTVVRALHGHLGHDEVGGVAFWADSALLAGAGIPTVVYGPVVGGIHGSDEWVDLASLQRCHDAYLAVARELCA
jgi:acetylornithine deacetylase/succinyl-diaminopimelate desuccinylase-like protein